MQDFSRKLLTEWRKLDLPFSGENIIIAVSGGADSCALAYAILDLKKRKKLKNNFMIAHFNHKLRDRKSDEDAEFVYDLANQLGFEFITESANPGDINSDANTEESARIARYKFLQRISNKTNSHSVLTAHTMNDQAETFLLNLIRGGGIEGLAGMRAIRKLAPSENVLLVRPILNWARREDILHYVKDNDIAFCEDSMNSDKKYTRVKIRKDLIPMLEEFNPNIVYALCNSAKFITNETELIDELLEENSVYNDLITAEYLEIKTLLTLSDAMLYRVLRGWLMNQRGSLRKLTSKHFQSAGNLIHSHKSGKIAELPNFQRIIKENGKLLFKDVEVEK